MPKVWLVVDGIAATSALAVAPVTMEAIAALKQAIQAVPLPGAEASVAVQLISVADLASGAVTIAEEDLFCPLTLELPAQFSFPQQGVYQDCRDVPALRQQVEQRGYAQTGAGYYWLPIVQTAKGPLYGEVMQAVGNTATGKLEDLTHLTYQQPLHLPDVLRQPLYQLGHRLLQMLQAPPSVYLMQFGLQAGRVVFDRLYPFPAAPAIASLNVQTPNLFECHWRCLTDQAILDLRIPPSVAYTVWESTD